VRAPDRRIACLILGESQKLEKVPLGLGNGQPDHVGQVVSVHEEKKKSDENGLKKHKQSRGGRGGRGKKISPRTTFRGREEPTGREDIHARRICDTEILCFNQTPKDAT